MDIAVFGTGKVGLTLGAALAAAGHTVTIGTRDPDATRARESWDSPLPLRSYADAAAHVPVVVLAVSGETAADALSAAGDLTGRVVLDLTNPLDFSDGFPPKLFVKDTDSLAETLQREHPGARVVKALNTVNVDIMIDPGSLADGDHTVFLAGDGEAARETVRGLLEDLGWRDIVEFPALDAARGLEMYLALWVRLMGRFGDADFNIKLVRK